MADVDEAVVLDQVQSVDFGVGDDIAIFPKQGRNEFNRFAGVQHGGGELVSGNGTTVPSVYLDTHPACGGSC